MTQRERLMKIIKDISSCKNNSCLNCCAEKECFFQQIATALLESGVIVLPCKVGDDVYVLNRAGEPQKMKFDSIDLRCTCTREDDCGLGTRCTDKEGNICQYRFKNDFSDFGKTVFLTYEEAEKAKE